MFFAPVVVEVRLQVPALTAAVQVCEPSLTVTLPVRAAPTVPGELTVTLQLTAYACPTTVGVELSEAALVMVVVVLAALTVWETPEDAGLAM